MNKEQLVNLVIIPTLKEIPKGLTDEAVMAITMIIAHESRRGNFLKQMGNGPALGLINMEPPTYKSTWKFGDSIWDNAFMMGIVTEKDFKKKRPPLVGRLIYDLRFNVFMCRQRLFMKPEKFPKTPYQMSAYLKKFWNSVHGAADSNSYLNDFNMWVK
jgi:hypothetical protein